MISFIALLSSSVVPTLAAVAFNQSQFAIVKTVVAALCAPNFVINDGDLCATIENATASVVCDANGNVNELRFDRKNCTGGFIAPEIGALPYIGLIDVRDSGIGGTLPPTLGLCSTLSILLTAGNFIRGFVPNELTALFPTLSVCLLMRIPDSNCFSCPLPTLPCTASLSCNTMCSPAPGSNATSTIQVASTTLLSTTTTTTTTVGTPMTTNPIVSTAVISTNFSITTTTMTTSGKETSTTSSTIEPTAQVSPSTSANVATSIAGSASTPSYQSRIFTHLYATQESALAPKSSPNVNTTIALVCSLSILVPLVILLTFLYVSMRKKSGLPSCCCSTLESARPTRRASSSPSRKHAHEVSDRTTESDSHEKRSDPEKHSFQGKQVAIYDKVIAPAPSDYDIVRLTSRHGARGSLHDGYILPQAPFATKDD